MASHATIPEQLAINSVCTLVYQLFLILDSAAQRYDIYDIRALADKEESQFLLTLRHYKLGAAYRLPDVAPNIKQAIILHNFCNHSWIIMKDLLADLLCIGK
ncbi:hypothetical protein DPSP01_013281 [Paraphaeosphaeria sporulosa]